MALCCDCSRDVRVDVVRSSSTVAERPADPAMSTPREGQGQGFLNFINMSRHQHYPKDTLRARSDRPLPENWKHAVPNEEIRGRERERTPDALLAEVSRSAAWCEDVEPRKDDSPLSVLSSDMEAAVEEVLAQTRRTATRLGAAAQRAREFLSGHAWEEDALLPALREVDSMHARATQALSRGMFGLPHHRLPLYHCSDAVSAERALNSALRQARARARRNILE